MKRLCYNINVNKERSDKHEVKKGLKSVDKIKEKWYNNNVKRKGLIL